jgi:beta-lactamase class A
MMKVPLMVAVLRWANDDPSRLDRKVRYDKPFGATVRTTFESVQIELGRSYTVRELMEKMIWNSDNEAAFLLMDVVTPKFAYSVMREVGIASPDQAMSGDFVSVREYASVFRLLYNATYLDRETSLTALRTLTRTTFDKGLRAQIPPEVMVAHKFGERILPDSPVRQLHDCGIVYHRTAPYVLCVMTRGHDMNKLAAIIADISGLTYRAVSRAESVH